MSGLLLAWWIASLVLPALISVGKVIWDWRARHPKPKPIPTPTPAPGPIPTVLVFKVTMLDAAGKATVFGLDAVSFRIEVVPQP